MDTKENKVNKLLGVSMDKIKEMVDVNTVMGEPINTPDGTTIIPVMRVSYGFGAGGSDLPSKNVPNAGLFAGGSGAGVSISPVGFLVVSGGDVKMVPITDNAGAAIDKILQTVPVAVDKVTDFFKKRKEKKEEI